LFELVDRLDSNCKLYFLGEEKEMEEKPVSVQRCDNSSRLRIISYEKANVF
jgi:hypothetical protein